MKRFCLIFSAAVIAVFSMSLYGHPGKTDSKGGHHDLKNGGYHFHNTGGKPYRPAVPASKKIYTSKPTPVKAVKAEAGKYKLPTLKTPDFSMLMALSVVRVVDGDTIVVRGNGEDIKVRLVGVDTPETVHPSKPVEHYGKEASRFTGNLLKGEKVYLVSDPEGDKVDRYGRTLAHVYRSPDGLFINAEIIRQGYGHAYTRFPFMYMEEFKQLEGFARTAGKGLWGSVGK